MDLMYKTRVQMNDMFSQFSRFIAPTYYHDRCERLVYSNKVQVPIRFIFYRTLQMYVYVMHKREVLLSLLSLFSVYILLLFIGLAGPNVDKVNTVTAQDIFTESNINPNYTSQLLSSGPFILTTPMLTPYAQQLSLHVTFSLKNEESSEAFHKDFDMNIQLDGVAADRNTSIICKFFNSSVYGYSLTHFQPTDRPRCH